MPEQLLTILKVCLLILLYLFFLRVLRAVWTEVKDPATVGAGAVPPRPRAPAASPRKTPGRRKRDTGPTELVTKEPAELAGTAHPLAPEMSIGRAAGCTIVIDDHYVSSVHTRVFRRDDQWMVEDLGSTNGTYLNRKKVTSPTVIHRGDQIQVGNVLLELS